MSKSVSMDTAVALHTPANIFGVRASNVRVHGQLFGIRGTSVRLQVALTTCEKSEWTSQSAITVRVATGIGSSKIAALTAGQLVGSTSAVFSLDSPQVSWLIRGNAPGTGAVLLTLTGVYMGPRPHSPGSRLQHTTGELTLWRSDTCVMALSLSGMPSWRQELPATITVAESTSTVTHLLTYDSPKLTFFRNGTRHLQRLNTPVTGDVLLTVVGANMGHVDLTPVVFLGKFECKRSLWLSATSVLCHTQHGNGRFQTASFTVGLKEASLTLAFSYDTCDPGQYMDFTKPIVRCGTPLTLNPNSYIIFTPDTFK